MALSFTPRHALCNDKMKMLYDVHVTDGSVVQLFPIDNEDHLKSLTKGIHVKSSWKWTHTSVVFGTLSDSGVICIWDLLTRRPIAKLEIEGAANCLSANFLIPPNGNQFIFLKDKFRLSFTELKHPTESVPHMTLVAKVEHVVGFCTPKVHQNHLIYPNGSNGIVAIGFQPHNHAVVHESINDGLIVSQLLPKPDVDHGMIVILTVIADWLVLAYEDGHVTVYNLENGQVMFTCDLKIHYQDEDDQSVTPMPMTCTGIAHLGKVIIGVAGVRPRLFVFDISPKNANPSIAIVPSVIRMDGCSFLATNPDDKHNEIAISGLSGSVDIYQLPDFTHLSNVPHREKMIKNLMFIRKHPNSGEIMLLCASDSNLSLWIST